MPVLVRRSRRQQNTGGRAVSVGGEHRVARFEDVIDEAVSFRRPGDFSGVLAEEIPAGRFADQRQQLQPPPSRLPAIQISEPSPVNPMPRSGPRTSGTVPRVRFWRLPLLVWQIQTSNGPSWSEMNAANFPSGEIVGFDSLPVKSVNRLNRAPASGLSDRGSGRSRVHIHRPRLATSTTAAAHAGQPVRSRALVDVVTSVAAESDARVSLRKSTIISRIDW